MQKTACISTSSFKKYLILCEYRFVDINKMVCVSKPWQLSLQTYAILFVNIPEDKIE